MPIATIGQPASATAPSQVSIGQEDFLKILTTQLSFQDPLKPMDNQQFMAQMAQFASLEQARQSNENTTALLQTQAATQSIGLIGRTVQMDGPAGAVTGTVTTVHFVNGTPLLTVRGTDGQVYADMSLSTISVIR